MTSGTMDKMKAGIQCRGMDIRKESRIASGAMDERKAGIQCRGMDIRKRRYVDVRNANEMRTVEEANKRLINQ